MVSAGWLIKLIIITGLSYIFIQVGLFCHRNRPEVKAGFDAWYVTL
jgi:hypothetical protein